MKTVSEREDLDRLLAPYPFSDYMTNNYSLIQGPLPPKTLYCEARDHALELFLDEGDHMEMFYHYKEGPLTAHPARHFQKPVLSRVLYKEAPGELRRALKEAGYGSQLILKEMRLSTKDLSPTTTTRLQWQPVTKEEAQEVYQELMEAFSGPGQLSWEDLQATVDGTAPRELLSCYDQGNKIGYIHMEVGPKKATLLQCFIRPEYRGQGLGRPFVHEAMEHYAPGRRSISLWVRRDNRPAISVYRAVGFRDTALLWEYFLNDKEDPQ